MDDLWFWKRWNKLHRRLYLFLLTTFFLSILYFSVGWFLGLEAVINWQITPDLETIDAPIDHFIHHLIRYSVEVNTFLVKQKYEPTGILIHPISSYIYFAFILIALIYFLSLITYLDIFWYGIGMAGFLFFLATLKTELLQVFGLGNRAFLIGLIALFLILTYYFHSFRKHTPFWQRMLSFALLFIVAGTAVKLGSKSHDPLFFLANFSVPVPIIVAVLFMIMVSFDMVYAFLYLVTSGKSANPKSRLLNFFIITLLYLLNLLLILLNKMRVIDWDILYLSPFLIFLVSSLVGIWAYRERSKKTNDAIHFAPHGAYLYLCLGIISIATIGLAFITGNDPLVEAFEYSILYTHLSFGVVFMLYVFINFGDLFGKNIPVYKVTYHPARLPYIIMQGVSFVLGVSLFLYSNKFAYYLAAAGYFNLGGDVYRHQHENIMAEEYYRQGFSYAFQNHRSNYSLGTIALEEGRNSAAQEYFTRALVRNQSPYAYVALSNIYEDASMFFPALFMLRDAVEVFPSNGPVNNNLGLLYGKTQSLDSTYFFLERASESGEREAVPSANILALLVKKGLIEEADSLAQKQSFEENPGFQNNQLIVQNLLGKSNDKEFKKDYVADSILDGTQFSYLYNYGLQKLKTDENHPVFQSLKEKVTVGENSNFIDHLLLVQALKNWYTGDKFEAIKQLDILKAGRNTTSPYFSKILGMLLFKQQAYKLAGNYLGQAHQDADQEAMLYFAISMVETGQKDLALPYFEKLSTSEFSDIKLIAGNLKLILTSGLQAVDNWDDELRYQYLHFNRKALEESQMLKIYESIRNENVKILAAAELMDFYLDRKELAKAKQISDQVNIGKGSGNYFIGEYNLQRLRILLAEEQWNELSKVLHDIYLNDYAKNNIPYYNARLHQAKNQLDKAGSLYLKAIQANPFEQDIYIYASRFFRERGKKDQAYEILVDGLEIMPNSIPMLKEFIVLAIELNLESFAEDALDKLSTEISQPELNNFKKELEAVRRKSADNAGGGF